MPQRETVSQALATTGGGNGDVARKNADPVRDMIVQYRGSFERILPEHLNAEAFTSLLFATLRKDRKLTAAARQSTETLIHAAIDCAALGHVPGHGYAFTSRKLKARPDMNLPERLVVLGIEEYSGMVQRMYRGGMIRGLVSEVVRMGGDKPDVYILDPSLIEPPKYIFDPWATFAQRGQRVGVFAYAKLADGSISRIVHLNVEQVMRHREAAEMKTIWDHPIDGEDMWRKSGLRVLHKFVPLSPSYLKWQNVAEAARLEEAETLPESPVRYSSDDTGSVIEVDPNVDILDDEESLSGEPREARP